MINIEEVQNGIMIRYKNEEETGIQVFENGETPEQELEMQRRVLYFLMDLLGWYKSKHESRIRIQIENPE